MAWSDRLLDTGIGFLVGGCAIVFGGAHGWQAVMLGVLTGIAGATWRRPWTAVVPYYLATGYARIVIGLPSSDSWNVAVAIVLAGSFGLERRPWSTVGGVSLVGLPIAWSGIFDLNDVLWVSLCLGGPALLANRVSRAWRHATTERSRAAALAAADAWDVASRAVRTERMELAAEVHRVVRTAIVTMRANARVAQSPDVSTARAAILRMQQDGDVAITKLRTLLGMLRQGPVDPPQPTPTSRARSRRPPRRDVALAAALAAGALIGHLFMDVAPAAAVVVMPWSILMPALVAASVVLRSIAPALGATLLGGVLLLSGLSGIAVSGWLSVTLAICILTWSTAYRRDRWSVIGVAAVLAGSWGFTQTMAPADYGLLAAIVLGVAAIALITADRNAAGQRAAETAAEVAALHARVTAEAVRAERAAVARELHDVVSNAVVVMIVQAGAADAQLDVNPTGAHEALAIVEKTAAAALAELDDLVLAVTDLEDTTEHQTVSGSVTELINRMRAGGLQVSLNARAEGLEAAGTTSGAVVYRVVREALTNALRHAGNSRVTVTISSAGNDTVVDIVDDGPGPATAAHRGFGLVGLTERVERLGGHLHTGSGPSGRGFRVSASIPVTWETAHSA